MYILQYYLFLINVLNYVICVIIMNDIYFLVCNIFDTSFIRTYVDRYTLVWYQDLMIKAK